MALFLGGLAAWRNYSTCPDYVAATGNMAVSDPQRVLSIQSHVASGYVGKSDLASNADCQATAQQPFLSKPLDMT